MYRGYLFRQQLPPFRFLWAPPICCECDLRAISLGIGIRHRIFYREKGAICIGVLNEVSYRLTY